MTVMAWLARFLDTLSLSSVAPMGRRDDVLLTRVYRYLNMLQADIRAERGIEAGANRGDLG